MCSFLEYSANSQPEGSWLDLNLPEFVTPNADHRTANIRHLRTLLTLQRDVGVLMSVIMRNPIFAEVFIPTLSWMHKLKLSRFFNVAIP